MADIQTNLKSIDELFTSKDIHKKNSVFKIPEYQRAYNW